MNTKKQGKKKTPGQPTSFKQAREPAFFLLFEWAFRPDEQPGEIAETTDEELRPGELSLLLAGRALENREQIDALIEQYSTGWKLGRLSQVTLALLRMAVCEILYFDDIPTGATINEAVELAKTYATPDDAAYLNGVLGAFVRDRQAAEK